MQITRTPVLQSGDVFSLSGHFTLLTGDDNYPIYQAIVREQITEVLGKDEIVWPEYPDDGDEHDDNETKTLKGTIDNFFSSNKVH